MDAKKQCDILYFGSLHFPTVKQKGEGKKYAYCVGVVREGEIVQGFYVRSIFLGPNLISILTIYYCVCRDGL